MPKKKIEKVRETRTMSKRAASKEAVRQMQSIISEQAAYDSPEATTLEITSEEEEEVYCFIRIIILSESYNF